MNCVSSVRTLCLFSLAMFSNKVDWDRWCWRRFSRHNNVWLHGIFIFICQWTARAIDSKLYPCVWFILPNL